MLFMLRRSGMPDCAINYTPPLWLCRYMLWLLCTSQGTAKYAHTLTWAEAIDTAARASAASRMMVVVLMLLVVGYLQGGATAATA